MLLHLFRLPSHFPMSSGHCASTVRFCGPGFSSPVECVRPRSAGNSEGEDFCRVLSVLRPNVCCTWKAMPGEPAKGGWALPRGRQRLTWPPSRRQLCACTSQGVPGGQATPVGKKHIQLVQLVRTHPTTHCENIYNSYNSSRRKNFKYKNLFIDELYELCVFSNEL